MQGQLRLSTRVRHHANTIVKAWLGCRLGCRATARCRVSGRSIGQKAEGELRKTHRTGHRGGTSRDLVGQRIQMRRIHLLLAHANSQTGAFAVKCARVSSQCLPRDACIHMGTLMR